MDSGRPHVVPKYIVYTFFLLGLFSAVAFRAIIVFQHLEPGWVRPVWYLAVVGYIFFFIYRFRISKKRKRAISDYNLIEKVRAGACLGEEEREVLIYLLSSIRVSLEDINYAIIFIMSFVAVAADILLTALVK